MSEIVLDVREDLKKGQEPFSKIMGAAAQVPPGGTLVLYATFKPTPLIAVLSRQGFTSDASPIEDGDWKVVFKRERAAPADDATPAAGGAPAVSAAADEPSADEASTNQGGRVIELNNRGLEPPMPMVNTLEAINQLQPGDRIVGLFDRRPMFLLPKLDQMGLKYEATEIGDGGIRLVIERAGED